MKATVVICTHNPRPEFLRRALASLRGQTAPYSDWDLIVVDNASAEAVAERFDLSWHPTARHVHEPVTGLTPARLRGFREARGDIVIMVDDDNILEPSYIESALRIASDFPFLGAWGGAIEPEFEVPPAEWTRTHWGRLALRECTSVVWTNVNWDWSSQPCGAGLCVRQYIAMKYRDDVERDDLRRTLGRSGNSLLSSEDNDIVLTSADFDLGWGLFPQLRMTHIIPRSRLELRYLLRLTEGIEASLTALSIRRNIPREVKPAWRMYLACAIGLMTKGPREARFRFARARGNLLGRRLAMRGKPALLGRVEASV